MNKLKRILFLIFILGFLIPQDLKMPVHKATESDYNSNTFWYFPWGKSVTHKGVDIFAKKGTTINSSTLGIVLYKGEIKTGGKIVVILGPKWRLHYYAHLEEIKTSTLALVDKKSLIGTVGTSGNAVGKQAHLHYSILTLIPYLWRIDNDRQGWKKMFFLNPIKYLEK